MPQRKIAFIDRGDCFLGAMEKPSDNQFVPYVAYSRRENWKSLFDDLESYESGVIDDLNAIFNRNREINFQLRKEVYTFRILPFQQAAASNITVTLQSGNNFFWIGLNNQSVIDLLDGENALALPQDIKCALFESALEPLLDQFDSWAGVKTHIRDVTMQDGDKDYGSNLFFNLVRRRDRLQFIGRISLAQAGLQWLARLYQKMPGNSVNQVDTLPVRAEFILGRTRLSLGEFKTLNLNDIVVLDQCFFYSDDQRCQIRVSENLCWEGMVQDNTIIINQFEGGNMTGENTENSATEQNITNNIDNLDVELIFELGRKQVAVGDLKRLQAGYTFDLEKELQHPVTLKANGKIIGDGQIVRIDERVGVKITTINLH